LRCICTDNALYLDRTLTSPGTVVRVNLATFARTGSITLNTGEDLLGSAVIDGTGTNAYFG